MTSKVDVLAQLRTTYCPPECADAVAEHMGKVLEIAGFLHGYGGAAEFASRQLVESLARIGVTP